MDMYRMVINPCDSLAFECSYKIVMGGMSLHPIQMEIEDN
jgi:hypothetical protein